MKLGVRKKKLVSSSLMIGLSGDLELDKVDRSRLRHGAVGGVILFSRNFESDYQLRQLTSEIRRASGREIVIGVDQEGGRVQRFLGGGFTRLPSSGEMGGDTELSRSVGMVMSAELLSCGLDISFAPVLDIDHGRSEIIGTRSYGGEAEQVTEMALSFAEGMKSSGMKSCGKHFPGHGYVEGDTHIEKPIDGRSYGRMELSDLKPFMRWSEVGGSSLMTSHIVYSRSDKRAATYSYFWLQEVLRKRMRYRGMIISDDLSMEGAGLEGGVLGRLERAEEAGCEGLLLCGESEIEEVLRGVEGVEEKLNPWKRLRSKSDGRISIGEEEYEESRSRILEFNGKKGKS